MTKQVLLKGILSCIPHRPPILLIDSVKVDLENASGIGKYNHSLKEQDINDFPLGCRSLPLLLLIEGIFQTAGVVRGYLDTTPNSRKKLLTTITFINFEGEALWGEDLQFEVTFLRVGTKFDLFRGEIWQKSERVLICEAMAGVKLG
ncbi:hypothetical protein [Bacillus cereus]|uniref:hypothetical protein n=1 Tax=Bacillus cereus TaxID=1396 RepID=UPI00065B9576|nr:hypothetical protein [Bacillus cereus]KMQ32181.1 hypothetical protein TU58_01460 [Bacillus cereus]